MRKPTLKELIKQQNLTVKDAVPPFTDVPIAIRQDVTHEQPLLWWHALAILRTINDLEGTTYTLDDISTLILFPDLTEQWGYTETVPRDKLTVAEIFFVHRLNPQRMALYARVADYDVKSLIQAAPLHRWKIDVLFEEISKELKKRLTFHDVYGVRVWEDNENLILKDLLEHHTLHPGLIASQANVSEYEMHQMLYGGRVYRFEAEAVLAQVNKHIGSVYAVESLTGVHILDDSE